MLRITTTRAAHELVLHLEGQVAGLWVAELQRVVDESVLSASGNGTSIVLDLGDVSFIDSRGVRLIGELANDRVTVANCSLFVAELLKEVVHGA